MLFLIELYLLRWIKFSVFRPTWWVSSVVIQFGESWCSAACTCSPSTDSILGLLLTSYTIWVGWPWEDHTKVEGVHKALIYIPQIKRYQAGKRFMGSLLEWIDWTHSSLKNWISKSHMKAFGVLYNFFWLSHGQAAVERGFSVKEVLAPNLKAVSLTALCLIHDTISEGQIEIGDYIITNELLTSCSHASNRYRMYLMERQKEDQEPEKN